MAARYTGRICRSFRIRCTCRPHARSAVVHLLTLCWRGWDIPRSIAHNIAIQAPRGVVELSSLPDSTAALRYSPRPSPLNANKVVKGPPREYVLRDSLAVRHGFHDGGCAAAAVAGYVHALHAGLAAFSSTMAQLPVRSIASHAKVPCPRYPTALITVSKGIFGLACGHHAARRLRLCRPASSLPPSAGRSHKIRAPAVPVVPRRPETPADRLGGTFQCAGYDVTSEPLACAAAQSIATSPPPITATDRRSSLQFAALSVRESWCVYVLSPPHLTGRRLLPRACRDTTKSLCFSVFIIDVLRQTELNARLHRHLISRSTHRYAELRYQILHYAHGLRAARRPSRPACGAGTRLTMPPTRTIRDLLSARSGTGLLRLFCCAF